MLILFINLWKIFAELYRMVKRKRLALKSGDLESQYDPPRKVPHVSRKEEQEALKSLQLKKCLSDFGYQFSKEGKLINVENGSGFVFEVKPGDAAFNQKHYEALGQVIDEEVYRMLEDECGLKKLSVPVDGEKEEVRGFIFASEDFLTNENMLILIHGSGVVRAGQWARRLIINDSLDSGTQIPYIKRARQMGFSVMVFNTNQNVAGDLEGRQCRIKGSEDPLSHALYVWDQYVSKSTAKNIAIVAHSAGGYVTNALAQKRPEQFIERVFAVAFTDSVHSTSHYSEAWNHMLEVSCNWTCSNKPLDAEMYGMGKDVKRLSAGTTIHEYTSHTAIESIFDFLSKRHKKWLERANMNIDSKADSNEAAADFSKISSEDQDMRNGNTPGVAKEGGDESKAGNLMDSRQNERKNGLNHDPKGEIVKDCPGRCA